MKKGIQDNIEVIHSQWFKVTLEQGVSERGSSETGLSTVDLQNSFALK